MIDKRCLIPLIINSLTPNLHHRSSHIFDGVNITKETAAFQLCDIHDRMLMNMIKDESDLREVCNVSLIHHISTLFSPLKHQ